jgi:RimJ/RimL family protein N-acetyltransferase
METLTLVGAKVRLSAETPDILAKAFTRWGRDSEYFRLLDSDPPRLWSEKKWKEWEEKDLERESPDSIFFGIRTLEGDQLVGFIALFDLYWNQGDTLVAIAIGEREYWGQGYGTDAMRLLLRYAFLELNLHRVGLIVFEYNPRAIASYEKAGFILEGRVRGMIQREGRRWDWLMMGILRKEWEQKYLEA